MTMETDEQRLKLNLIDRGFVGARPIMGIFYYENRLDPQRVYEGVRAVLSATPIFSARIVEGEGESRWMEHVPDLFSFAASERPNVSAEALLEGELLLFRDLAGMIDDSPTELGQPLLGVRVTQLREGTLLSVASSHACADAEAGRLFMMSLMMTLMGHPPLRLSKQRSFPFQRRGEPAGQSGGSGDFREHSVTRSHAPRPGGIKSLSLAGSVVAGYLEELKGTACTPHDAIAAWVIKNQARWFLPDRDTVNVRIPISVRSLVEGIEPTYVGNAFVDCFLTWPVDVLERTSFREVAVAVREAIEAARAREYLAARIEIDEHGLNYDGFIGEGTQGFDPERDLIISSIGEFQAKIGGANMPKIMFGVPAVPLCCMVQKSGDDYLLQNFNPRIGSDA